MTSPPPSLPRPGTVYLVGAGPGDPDLITVRGLRLLRNADVVLYDRLLHPALLQEARHALKIFVGKSVDHPGVGQEGIHRLLIHHAQHARVVVRLKGGDPYVFGRGSEEAEALAQAGIPWEVVPAVSSAFGAPAAARIPLTHRSLARSFVVVTAHQVDHGELPWAALVEIDTLVVLMGVAALPRLAARLLEHGKDPSTPAAVVARGTLPDQKVVVSTLAHLAQDATKAGIRSPATIVIGEVVQQRERSLLQPRTAELTPYLNLKSAEPLGVSDTPMTLRELASSEAIGA